MKPLQKKKKFHTEYCMLKHTLNNTSYYLQYKQNKIFHIKKQVAKFFLQLYMFNMEHYSY